jgi:amino acid transporter
MGAVQSTVVTSDAFPSRSGLPRVAPWWAAVLEGVAGAIMVIVSLGAMAGELGSRSIWVWVVTAVVGGLQCIVIASLARRFDFRAGGTPQYAYLTRENGSRTLGALSGWCYWFAWTPAIVVNLIVAATYVKRLLWPSVSVVVLAVCMGAVLYVVTSLGLRLTVLMNTLLAAIAILVVLLIIVTPVFHPSAFHPGNLMPKEVSTGGAGGALYLKWAFVATWTSYAPELAASLSAEVNDPKRTIKKIMTWSAAICVVAFCALPIVLFGMFGADALQQDPFLVFAAAGNTLFGPTGGYILGLGLIVVLLFGAEAFIIGSSRTIYQMSLDGYLPKAFGKVNRRGAPVGSIVWDAAVITVMITVFGVGVVNQIAAANFGYMVVFTLLPITYLAVRARSPKGPRTARRHLMTALAVGLLIFNATLLFVGGAQWGWRVIVVGTLGSLVILPISLLTRGAARRSRTRSPEPTHIETIGGSTTGNDPHPTTEEAVEVETPARTFADVLPASISSVGQGGIAASHRALNPTLQRLHSRVLRMFLERGYPPTREEVHALARECELDGDLSIAALVGADLLHFTDDVLSVAYPLSAQRTPHTVVTTAYPPVKAMCAIDALGVLSMTHVLGTVNSSDPITKKSIRITRTENRWSWDPPEAVVVLAAEIGCCGPIAEACTFTAFYASRESATAGLVAHGEVCGRVLSQEEAECMASLEFGGLLDADLEPDQVSHA